VNLLEFFITYLAIGAAFAMRGYFLNRRRQLWTRLRIVLTQCLFWLPICLLGLTKRAVALGRPSSTPEAGFHLEIEKKTQRLLSESAAIREKNQIREALERYSALHAALNNEPGRASGQFELFAISGNGNGTTGTPCLYRKNLSKLRIRKLRTADDLIRVTLQYVATDTAVSDLAAFFNAFADRESVAKLEAIDREENVVAPSHLRTAA
jgi:hypothetical protein